MSSKCLVTQLKGVVDNDNLPTFGELIIPIIAVPEDSDSRRYLTFKFSEEVTITSDGNGYFATSAEAVETDRLTTITLQPNIQVNLYFNRATFNFHISNKYVMTYLGNGSDSTANKTSMVLNIEDIEYCTELTYLRLGIGNSFGDIKAFKNLLGLSSLSAVRTLISGNLSTIANLVQLESLRVYNSNVTGSIESFVAGQIANGRTTCLPGDLECRYILKNISFGGNTYTGDGMQWLSWESASKIIVWKNTDSTVNTTYSYSNVDTIYAKGATTEEIEQWESDGKTVVVIN